MGAIGGIIYPDIFGHTKEIDPMLLSLMHRGCQSPQTYIFHEIQVGCCGCLLYTDEKNGFVVGGDGTIHNLAELRQQLEKKGHSFSTDLNSEVLSKGYLEWKEALFPKLRGEFAFFILDLRAEQLVLVRDPLGKKPLYWYAHQNTFLFASEIKALLASGFVAPSPSNEAMAAYLFLGYIPQDMSPIEEVNKLLPGYYMVVNKDRSFSINSYWSYSSFFMNQKKIPEKEALEQFRSLLEEATYKRIPKERPIGCTLSGGLGSGSIAYLLSEKLSHKDLHSVTVAFKDQYTEDAASANAIAAALSLKHETLTLTPETSLDSLVSLMWYLDEPLADPHIMETWNLGKLAARNAETVFSGMGSDELLGGHMRYDVETPHSLLSRFLSPLRNLFLSCLIPFDKADAFAFTRRLRTNPWQYEYLKQNALFSLKEMSQIAPELSHLFDPRVFLNRFYHISRVPTAKSGFLYFDVKTRLADAYILQYDRLMNANHVNWETPFLDIDLVEFLASLPPTETKNGPRFLSDLLPPNFPPSVKYRPKRTRKDFLAPWAGTPPLVEIFPLLKKGVLVSTGVISEKWLAEATASPATMEKEFGHLWGILILEIWFRLFIHRPPDPYPPFEIPLQDFLQEE